MTKPTTDQIREAITKAAGGMFFPTEAWPARERIESLVLQEDVLSGATRIDGPVGVIAAAARQLAETNRAEMVPLVLGVVFGDAATAPKPAVSEPPAQPRAATTHPQPTSKKAGTSKKA